MKRFLALVLCLLLLVSLISCKGGRKKKGVNLDDYQTLGDLFDLGQESVATSCSESKFVYVVELNGTTYRFSADVTPEIFEEYCDIDYFDEEKDQKERALLGDLKIATKENLSQYIPTAAELKKFVGMTGQELFEADFSSEGYNLMQGQVFYMAQGMFSYDVYFNETLEVEDFETFDPDEAILPLTVKKMVYTGFSQNVTDME